MAAPECSVLGCGNRARYLLSCPTTERLNENWYVCLDHVPRILRFLTERDLKWDVPEHSHGAQEVSQA